MPRSDMTIETVAADDLARLGEVRRLFEEYAASLAIDLSFQNFAGELASLPGDYAPPGGALMLAQIDAASAGCVAVRRLDQACCEMKRLFIRPAFQQSGYGRLLAEAAIDWARGAGYQRMRLDTLPTMAAAQRMYLRLGFVDVPAYRFNPIPGSRFMEKALCLA